MAISLARVDDRVIHGQVVTAWTQQFPADGIVVVDDAIAGDEMMASIYRSAAPGVRVLVYTQEQAKIKVPEASASAKNYFLITRSVTGMDALAQAGLPVGKRLIVGPASLRENTVTVGHNQSLTPDEIAACHSLSEQGIELVFQLTPSTRGINWSEIRTRISQANN